jgi:hypothetical protein
MAGLFLTTPALHISLLWRESPLSKSLAAAPVSEVWVSPLSHAILIDTYLKPGLLSDGLRRRGLRAVEGHRRRMETSAIATFPLPNREALRIWAEIRSLQVDIPAYSDGIASYPVQKVGPDELLVFATAAALSVPLAGPAPSDPETIEYLKDVGITFR